MVNRHKSFFPFLILLVLSDRSPLRLTIWPLRWQTKTPPLSLLSRTRKLTFRLKKCSTGKFSSCNLTPLQIFLLSRETSESNIRDLVGKILINLFVLRFVRIFTNYVGWKARVLEYGKAMQLASNDTHLSRLKVQMAEAENTLAKLDANLQSL